MPTHPDNHLHAHQRGDAKHRHYVEGRNQTILAWAVVLTLGFAAIEAVTGIWSNSLALISDAGHMITDSAALGLALLAQFISKRPPTAKNTFGFGRAEALAAFVNSLVMLAVIGWISVEALIRFSHPVAVQGMAVILVASAGLVINMVVAWVLSKDRHSLNTRSALVHVMGDLLGSVAAIISGAVIYKTGWMQIDPLLSILVCILLLKSTLGVLRHSFHFLMEGVPSHINYQQIGDDMEALPGVVSVHDLHIWEMSPGFPALIGHIEIRELQEWPEVLPRIRTMLLEKHGIDHVTLQAEIGE